jgi:predicted amidophosphoribosyltransferase
MKIRRIGKNGMVHYHNNEPDPYKPFNFCPSCGKLVSSHGEWCEKCIKRSSDEDFANELAAEEY